MMRHEAVSSVYFWRLKQEKMQRFFKASSTTDIYSLTVVPFLPPESSRNVVCGTRQIAEGFRIPPLSNSWIRPSVIHISIRVWNYGPVQLARSARAEGVSRAGPKFTKNILERSVHLLL